ncbi:hypothetical protein JKP88DRAFT_264262 [Tribonema minus]|uniref:Uncharacterized protein n=1 Tax=Tribonema minus TaxID=303371 RepID=A0A836CAP2_9STRA|nr:hypothetical protein JKP88DRAFT_264262 [Tribonema minus]
MLASHATVHSSSDWAMRSFLLRIWAYIEKQTAVQKAYEGAGGNMTALSAAASPPRSLSGSDMRNSTRAAVVIDPPQRWLQRAQRTSRQRTSRAAHPPLLLTATLVRRALMPLARRTIVPCDPRAQHYALTSSLLPIVLFLLLLLLLLRRRAPSSPSTPRAAAPASRTRSCSGAGRRAATRSRRRSPAASELKPERSGGSELHVADWRRGAACAAARAKGPIPVLWDCAAQKETPAVLVLQSDFCNAHCANAKTLYWLRWSSTSTDRLLMTQEASLPPTTAADDVRAAKCPCAAAAAAEPAAAAQAADGGDGGSMCAVARVQAVIEGCVARPDPTPCLIS